MARKVDPELRVRILKEAEHLLHLHGYHGTSLDEIASSCRMTKANLIHHFKSKEDLGLAVLDYKIDAYRKQRLSTITDCPEPGAGIDRLFSAATDFFGANGCKAGCFVGNIALEMSDINDRFRARVESFFNEWIAQLAKCLACAGRRSEPAAQDRSTAEAILALYEGAIMLARSRRDPAVFRRVGLHARRLLEHAKKSGFVSGARKTARAKNV